MKAKVTIIIQMFLSLCVWFGITRGYTYFIDPFLAGKVPEVLQMVLSSMVIPYGVALPIFFFLVRKMKVQRLEESSEKKLPVSSFIRIGIIQSGVSMFVMFVVNIMWLALGNEMTGVVFEQVSNYLIFYIVLLLIFNPIMEEILFRKLVLERLRPLGDRSVIIVCAIFFALPHVISLGIPQMFYTFVLGLIWSYVTVKTGKLLPAILLHAFSNLYGTFLPMILTRTEVGMMLYMVIWMVVMPIMAVILLIRYRLKAQGGTH